MITISWASGDTGSSYYYPPSWTTSGTSLEISPEDVMEVLASAVATVTLEE
jgi:hypothetical protein